MSALGEQSGARPRVLLWGSLGALLMWLAQPPAGLWPLAYAGAACWLALAADSGRFGLREYLRVWLAGSLYWLLAIHWVVLPHPLTVLGWPLLAAYLAAYSLATIAATRRAHRRWGVPLWLAGPIAWTGCELLQARLFTGFLMGAVSHSHAGQGWVRAIAAYLGAYGVTFVVVLIAAALADAVRRRTLTAALGVVAAITVAWGGGALATIGSEAADAPTARVALIQGDTRATWDPDPNRSQKIMNRQVELTGGACDAARADGERFDLIVWPESMFRAWLLTFGGSADLPDDANASAIELAESHRNWLRSLASLTDGSAFLAGVDRFDWPLGSNDPDAFDGYNSVLLAAGEDGRLVGYYDKNHLVPFGEYIPLARNAPALYYLTPMAGGLVAGEGPTSMTVPTRDGRELRLCPSICYETVVPRVIRRHVAELTARGERPDVLVNVTNDAWFWGSSELDMHLACGVYRAVENGLPLLIAANGGLSAIIDAHGDVLQVSDRMTEAVVAGQVPARRAQPTFYSTWGDCFAVACCAATLLTALDHVVQRVRARPLNADAG